MAEDVTQESFLAVLRRPEAFQSERASLRTYLCAIARHLAPKQLRRRGAETALDDPPETAVSRGRWDAAVASYRQAIAASPGDAVLHNKLGTCYLRAGDLKSARNEYKAALDLRKDYAEARSTFTLRMARVPS